MADIYQHQTDGTKDILSSDDIEWSYEDRRGSWQEDEYWEARLRCDGIAYDCMIKLKEEYDDGVFWYSCGVIRDTDEEVVIVYNQLNNWGYEFEDVAEMIFSDLQEMLDR